MNASCCSQNDRRARGSAQPQKSWVDQGRQVTGFIVPGTVLTLLPKCPVCFAAYVALGTGLTLSFSAARLLLHTITVLCLGALGLCLARCLLNSRLNKRASNL